MLKTYQLQNGGLRSAVVGEGEPVPPNAIWIDLLNPTLEEREKVAAVLGTELPTRADMEEIEISSRLYQENGNLFMTAMILSQMDSDVPLVDAITFVLSHDKLATLRYIDPQPFRTLAHRADRGAMQATKPEMVLMQILDIIIDRMADILERTGADVEAISREIFDPTATHRIGGKDFQDVLRRLGRKHGLTSKMRESLLTIIRMLTFLNQATDTKPARDVRGHVKTLTRDVLSLQDHSTFIANKLSYLQDATLGLINNEQNNIIKIMSVAAMVFLPPTLFASVWGMNFRNMPELSWVWGYPIAIGVIFVAAILPYVYFKRKGWL